MTLVSTRRGIVKSAILYAIAPTVLTALPTRAAASGIPDDPVRGRNIVFEDHFTSLDPAIWNKGPKATTGDSGFYGRSAFAREGGEAGFDPYAIVRDETAEDGSALQITAKYIGQPLGIEGYHGNDDPEYQWVSGNIQTATKEGAILKGWSHGYFEARMWMPRHPLTWAAFWFLNGRSILWPQTSIEIDVVEHKGWELDLYGTYLHEWGMPGEHHEGSGVATSVDVTQGYHLYGVLVEDGACMPYFDRTPVRNPETGELIRWIIGRTEEMERQGDVYWPLLTLAMRNDVPYPERLTEEELSPRLNVDYFRVYQ